MSTLRLRDSELQRQAEVNRRTIALEEGRLSKLSQELTDRGKALEKTKTLYKSLSEENTTK